MSIKQAVFTGCVQSGVLQNRFPAGNGSVPSPVMVVCVNLTRPKINLTGKHLCGSLCPVVVLACALIYIVGLSEVLQRLLYEYRIGKITMSKISIRDGADQE